MVVVCSGLVVLLGWDIVLIECVMGVFGFFVVGVCNGVGFEVLFELVVWLFVEYVEWCELLCVHCADFLRWFVRDLILLVAEVRC